MPRNPRRDPTVSPLRKGVPLNSQAIELVRRVRNYYEQESVFVKQNGHPSIPAHQVIERTAKTLGLSKRTVLRQGIKMHEVEEAADGEGEARSSSVTPTIYLGTPGKKKFKPSPKTTTDSFQEDAIRRHIYNYYRLKEYPTIQKLLHSLMEAELFNGGKTSLRTVLRKIGFRYKVLNGRRLLMERPNIVMARSMFLHKLLGRDLHSVVWLDETWVNAGESLKVGWTDDTKESCGHRPTGKGGRLIVVHAGSSSGFIDNALLMFKSKKTGDYHEEMDHNRFSEWFENLLKQLEGPSTIVMDNAPYHSVRMNKVPTSNARKDELLHWLQEHNVPADMGMTKVMLYTLVQQNKPATPTYVIDEMAHSYGHEVIRLPPYHCHFNPIELVWADVKFYVRNNNKSFTVTEVERLFREGVAKIDATTWKNKVHHVEKLINEAQKIDGIISEHPQLMISLGDDSDSDDDSEQDSTEEYDNNELEGIAPLPE